MDADNKKTSYVKVKDGAGNSFVCPIDALRDPKQLSDSELEECIDDAVMGRYAGNLDIMEEVTE